MLGLAFVVVVAGVCWLVAEKGSFDEISEIWLLPAAVGGVFVGALIPLPTQKWVAILLASAGLIIGVIGTDGDRLALYVIATTLGAVSLGLFIPSPGHREQ